MKSDASWETTKKAVVETLVAVAEIADYTGDRVELPAIIGQLSSEAYPGRLTGEIIEELAHRLSASGNGYADEMLDWHREIARGDAIPF